MNFTDILQMKSSSLVCATHVCIDVEGFVHEGLTTSIAWESAHGFLYTRYGKFNDMPFTLNLSLH